MNPSESPTPAPRLPAIYYTKTKESVTRHSNLHITKSPSGTFFSCVSDHWHAAERDYTSPRSPLRRSNGIYLHPRARARLVPWKQKQCARAATKCASSFYPKLRAELAWRHRVAKCRRCSTVTEVSRADWKAGWSTSRRWRRWRRPTRRSGARTRTTAATARTARSRRPRRPARSRPARVPSPSTRRRCWSTRGSSSRTSIISIISTSTGAAGSRARRCSASRDSRGRNRSPRMTRECLCSRPADSCCSVSLGSFFFFCCGGLFGGGSVGGVRWESIFLWSVFRGGFWSRLRYGYLRMEFWLQSKGITFLRIQKLRAVVNHLYYIGWMIPEIFGS